MLTSGIMREIKLLQRHMQVMKLLANEPMGIVRLSQATNIPVHQIRYSLRILQQNSLLSPSTKGAVLSGKGKGVLNSFSKQILIKELEKL